MSHNDVFCLIGVDENGKIKKHPCQHAYPMRLLAAYG
jgi:hypothetical protein